MLQANFRSDERGDTLIEVLVSILVLSMVIVGSITIMTAGLAAAQNALEHSQVRLSINSQTEMLRFLRDQYAVNRSSSAGQLWEDIVDAGNTQAVDYNTGCEVTPAKSGTAFYLAKDASEVQRNSFDASIKPETVALPGQGLWVEYVLSEPAIDPAYVDFVVRACWSPAGGTASQQRTVTAVRLYDPSR